MSATPPSGSTWYRLAVTGALGLYWLTMFAATHVPKIPKAFEPSFSDKWQHYVGYAGLGFLLSACWFTRRPLSWKRAAWLSAVPAVYGAFDEVTQPLFGRDAELLDWRADIVGGVTGIALYAILSTAIRHMHKGNQTDRPPVEHALTPQKNAGSTGHDPSTG